MRIQTILWLLWTLLLLLLLLLPLRDSVLPSEGRYWDKIVHCGLFAITGFISIYGAVFFSKFSYRLIFGVIFGLVLALGTELGQALVPHRHPSSYDFVADIIGLCCGVLAYILLHNWGAIRSRFKL